MTVAIGKNMVYVKQQNESAIKKLLYRNGAMSRAAIAKQLNLSPPTITNIVAEMQRQGIVRELEATEDTAARGVGRKPISIDFVADAHYVLGISLGRDSTHGVVTDLRGGVVRSFSHPQLSDNYEEMLAALQGYLQELRTGEPAVWGKLMAIGLSMPGIVDHEHGVLKNHGAERKDWCNRPLAEDIRAFSGLPVYAGNNVRARARALMLFRPELLKDDSSFALCHLNWGIACPVFITKASGQEISFSGEIGHMVMDPEGPSYESFGTPGSLEMFASVYTLMERSRWAMREGKAPILASLKNTPEELTPHDLWTAQRLGDDFVCRSVRRAMNYIGIALANLVTVMNVNHIFLSGEAFQNTENIALVQQALDRYAFDGGEARPPLTAVSFGEYGGALGACAVCLWRHFIA